MQVFEPHSGSHFETSVSGAHADPLVVLVHGSLDRSGGMAKVARVTARFAEVVRYDRRGYGDRWDHPGPFSVDGNMDDVAAIVGDRRAVVIGHSYGGQVALAAAQQLGDRIVAVSTYETPLSWLEWWPGDTPGAVGVAAGNDAAAETFMIKLIGRDRWERLPERTKIERKREGRALVEELSALRSGPSWNPSSIACPVVCARGSLAPEHHRRAVEWLVDSLPRARAAVIAEAGHGAHMSHPDSFVDQLIRPHFEASGTFTEIS